MSLTTATAAILAGMGVALATGPLGTVMIWRRMSYFSETLAHSTLLGASLSILLDIHIFFGVLLICLLVAGVLVLLQNRQLALDTLLGILAHVSLALGLIAASFLSTYRMDVLSYFYGDILAVDTVDLLWIAGVVAVVWVTLAFIWQNLFLLTIDEDMAVVEEVPVKQIKFIFVLLLALVIAVAMKLVGVLLITALLIIPAATARQLSKSPEQMALFAMIAGMIGVILGIAASLQWDWPTGPAIVLACGGCFLVSVLVKSLQR